MLLRWPEWLSKVLYYGELVAVDDRPEPVVMPSPGGVPMELFQYMKSNETRVITDVKNSGEISQWTESLNGIQYRITAAGSGIRKTIYVVRRLTF